MSVDFSEPLEVIDRCSGEIYPLDPMRPNHGNQFWPFMAYSQKRGDDFFINVEKGEVNSGNSAGSYSIRNRQPTPSTDRLARLEAFVARVAEFKGIQDVVISDRPGIVFNISEAARNLVTELNPVDPLLIKARRIALDEWQPTAWDDDAWESRVMSGDEDEDRAVRSAYSALRQARKEGQNP